MLVGEHLVVPDGEVVVVHEAGGRAALAVRVQVAVAVAVCVAVGRQQQVGARAEDGSAAATHTVVSEGGRAGRLGEDKLDTDSGW